MRCEKTLGRLGSAPVNILVVDDEVELCTLLSRFLEKHGQRVYSAQDALQAFDILERVPIQFIISDIRMPHVDGLRFVEILKKDPRFQAVPIILFTAAPSEQVSNRGLKSGAAMVLDKPVDFDRLLNLVRFAE